MTMFGNDHYRDEPYAIIGDLNTTKKRTMIDAKKLDAFLATVSKRNKRAAPSRNQARTLTRPGTRRSAKQRTT